MSLGRAANVAGRFRVPIAMILLAGCSMSAQPYAISPDTVAALRTHKGVSVKVGPFTAREPGRNDTLCRLYGTVKTPGGVPFETFVRDALRAELLVAGLEAADAPVTLTGHLERMDISSHSGTWFTGMTLTSSNGARLTVADEYEFNWSFMADRACREATTALVPAVQSLIRKAVSHPEFAALLKPR